MTAAVLRVAAAAIAVAALIDPALTVSVRGRARVAIVESGARDPVLRSQVRRRVAAALGSEFDVVDGPDRTAAHTVAIGARYPVQPISGAASTVSLDDRLVSGVRIVQVAAPRAVPPATAVHVTVLVEASNAAATSSTVVVSSAGIEVGRAEHAWTRPLERWRADVDVVPAGRPPYVMQARINSSTGRNPESGVEILVSGREEPMRVLVYEPRPSWASTFVRRALEMDSRFRVASLTIASRGVAVNTAAPPALTAAVPDEFDVVVAGGLERLTASDMAWLDRFARERGGAVVLVPDSRVDLRPFGIVHAGETLLEKAAPLEFTAALPRIDASEMLTLTMPPGADAIARVGSTGEPAIISVPSGAGRVLVSGALDAWRYRAEPGVGFDRFWQSLVAGLALGARPGVDAEVEPALLRPGDSGTLRVRVGPQWVGAPLTATVTGGDPIRLWPAGAAGTYTGRFVAPVGRQQHSIRVSVASPGRTAEATADMVVGDLAVPADATGVPLVLLARSRGGIDVTPSELNRLRTSLVAHVPAPETKRTIRPMRSAWWMWPFAGCLAAEWWIRRRQGLR